MIFKRLNKLLDFIFKFKQVVKDIEGCFKFIYIHIFYTQNWQNCLMNYHQLVRLKGEKKTLASHAWINKVCLFLFGPYRQKVDKWFMVQKCIMKSHGVIHIGETINWLIFCQLFFSIFAFLLHELQEIIRWWLST